MNLREAGLSHESTLTPKKKVPAGADGIRNKSHPWESNPKPIAYEAIALPIELGWRGEYYTSIVRISKFWTLPSLTASLPDILIGNPPVSFRIASEPTGGSKCR